MTLAYTTGTINLTQGSAIITGNGTGWATALIAGGVIYPDAVGNALPILSVDSDTQIKTVKPWRGGSGSNVGYSIVRDTAYLQQTTANANALAAYLSELDSASLGALAALASTMSAGRVPRALGGSSMEWMQVTDAAKALLDDADAPAMRATLGELFYKNGANRNDTLTGAAADFNAIPGDGVWRLDRGGGQAVLNGPTANLESGLAYRCLQIGDSTRGTQIAMGYVSGMLYVRTGADGWGSWYILPTNRQTVSLSAIGGDESDLATGDALRLSIPFTATTGRIMAAANWCFWITASTAVELVGTVRLWDATASVIVADRINVYTGSPSDNDLGYKGATGACLSYGTLTIGRSYALQLLMRKSAAIGPIYPRCMQLSGILF